MRFIENNGFAQKLSKSTRPDTRHKVLRNTVFRRQREGVTDLRTDGRTDGRTDERTDERTDPLIEVLCST